MPPPPPPPQWPFGFRPAAGFKLPHYSPRAPASSPTPKQVGPAALPLPLPRAPACPAPALSPSRSLVTFFFTMQLGYTMPGEFEPHAACWMGWPTSGYLWREEAKPAQREYAGIARAISQFEPVKMMASPGAVSCRGGPQPTAAGHRCSAAAANHCPPAFCLPLAPDTFYFITIQINLFTPLPIYAPPRRTPPLRAPPSGTPPAWRWWRSRSRTAGRATGGPA